MLTEQEVVRQREAITEEIFSNLSETQVIEYAKMKLDDVVDSLRYMMRHSDIYDNDKEWWNEVGIQVQQVSNVYVTGL